MTLHLLESFLNRLQLADGRSCFRRVKPAVIRQVHPPLSSPGSKLVCRVLLHHLHRALDSRGLAYVALPGDAGRRPHSLAVNLIEVQLARASNRIPNSLWTMVPAFASVIVGMGTGSLRPTLTYGVANSANITFSGDNMSVYNILFVSNFLDVASALTATGTPTDFTVQGCEFRATSTTKDFLVCVTGVATDAACDGLQFNGNKVYGLDATTATHAVSLLEATDRVDADRNRWRLCKLLSLFNHR